MSGTSLDGIDASLVKCSQSSVDFVDALCVPYPKDLREQLSRLITEPRIDFLSYGQLNIRLAKCYADAVAALIKKTTLESADIKAIGCHGQTIFHHPPTTQSNDFFSLQLGDPSTLAKLSKIDVVADFRNADIALGGQGAPLAPSFHQFAFSGEDGCAVLNLGGIANVSLISPDNVIAFDTGPASTLLDTWIQKHQQKQYDDRGSWATSGSVNQSLLQLLMDDPYFKEAPPKSTGFERFNLNWLQALLDKTETIAPQDVQATLLELTATSISDALGQYFKGDTVFVCGGGIHNTALINRLKDLNKLTIVSTEERGINPDWMEAMAFAWFAYKNLKLETVSLPDVTGATKATILGGLYRHN